MYRSPFIFIYFYAAALHSARQRRCVCVCVCCTSRACSLVHMQNIHAYRDGRMRALEWRPHVCINLGQASDGMIWWQIQMSVNCHNATKIHKIPSEQFCWFDIISTRFQYKSTFFKNFQEMRVSVFERDRITQITEIK